jgi:signal transduction histidine kinase
MRKVIFSPPFDRSILVQVGAVLILCQLLAHALTITFMTWRYERPDLLSATSVETVQAIALHEVLRQAEPAERKAVEAAILRVHPDISVRDAAGIPLSSPNASARNDMLDGLKRARPDLGETALLLAGGDTINGGDLIALPLPEDRLFVFSPERGNPRITFPRIVAALFVTVLVVPLAFMSLWGLRMLTAPLSQLARSADRFAIDLDPQPLPERGPSEIRTLAHAFNQMKRRIHELVEGRSRMLAAVSHDLRTPLTRLRLRAEAMDDSDEKNRTLRDLGAMETMIRQSLTYLRDQSVPLRRQPVDMGALLETLCDDFRDMGHEVKFTGPRDVVLVCEPDLLTRAISNVVDNAIKFGGAARVSLAYAGPDAIRVRVEDNGPGVAEADKVYALEPFSRGDKARGSTNNEGFGLGLAIARQIVERHGGAIKLLDIVPTGLAVEIDLPADHRPTVAVADLCPSTKGQA